MRGVQVVDVDLVLDGVVAVVVGGAVAECPALTPPPASHMVKPSGLWSRPSAPLQRRRAAELAAPEDQRVVEQAARFQVLEQAGDRLVDLAGVLRVALLEVAVLVPLHFASLCVTCTKRTPRSANRRAIRHWRPKLAVTGSSRP